MCQGPGDNEPAPVRRPRALPDETQGPARLQPVGAHDLGRSARDIRRADPKSNPGGARRGGHVPRGAPWARRLHGARAAGLGSGWAQLPHQHLFGRSPLGIFPLAGRRPALTGLRERPLHPAHLRPPGGRPLLQPARATDHRSQDGRCQAHRGRPQALEHGLVCRLMACPASRHRGRSAPGHGQGDP